MKNSNGSNYTIAVTLDRTINKSDKYNKSESGSNKSDNITILSVVVFWNSKLIVFSNFCSDWLVAREV